MISLSRDVRSALRDRQRGFLLNPYRFGASTPVDPYFANVVLLLHCDGANGGTTFTDSSSKARVPASSTGATTVTATKVFGTASMAISGASPSGVLYNDSADFTLGTGNFTLELWACFNAGSVGYWIMGQSDSGGGNASISIALQRTAANKIRAVACSGAATIADITSTSSVTTATWYYLAFGRQGNTFRLFIDAVAEGTATSVSAVNDSSQSFGLGRLGTVTTSCLDGNIDELRYTVGVYRDIASIGVPTSAFPNS